MRLHQIAAIVGLLCCLADCTPAAAIPSTPLPIPSPTSTSILPSAASTRAPSPTATATVVPSHTPTQAASPTAASTPLPSPTILYDPLRQTPPTLMLHRSSQEFDSVAFLQDFVHILQDHQMRVVTYQDLSRQPDLTAIEQGRLVILTIDDVSLQAPIDPSIQQMIAILRQAGYPAVLGIVTAGKLADEDTSAALKGLAAEGWELAMHTENHVDLHELEKVSPYGARLEIRTCAENIETATGVKPSTLVLPYGSMVEDFKILYREHVQWVVGISGGKKYRTTHQVYYVGREGPSGGAQQTFDVMLARFKLDEFRDKPK